MKKIFGILGLLIAVCLVTASLSDSFLSAYNVENVLRRSALFGILSIGVAFVIITGGIDLSLGSVVCLVGCALPWLLTVQHWPVPLALLAVVALSLGIGLFHGLLITKLRIQPFIVTLCGLLLYRGIARGFTADQTVGFGNEFKSLRLLATGKVPFLPGFDLPAPLLFLAVVAILAAVFLNRTIYGRYLLALGRNPQAATYSGISTAHDDSRLCGEFGLGGFGWGFVRAGCELRATRRFREFLRTVRHRGGGVGRLQLARG